MSALPDLMRRIDRKLDIQRGLSLTYDDLALLVASGAYAKLQDATREYLERQCREHVARNHSIDGGISSSTREKAGTTKSFGTTANDDANEALARAQATLKPPGSRSTSTISTSRAANTSRRSAERAR